MLLWSLCSRKWCPKGTFLKSPKIENGTKIKFFNKDRHQDPLKTVPGSGFEKTMKKCLEMNVFRSEKHAPSIGFPQISYHPTGDTNIG